MYPSIYHAILTNASLQEDKMMEAINDIAVSEKAQELFTPIADQNLPPGHLKAVLLYIAYAYSKESKMLVSTLDSIEQKKLIAERVHLPDTQYEGVVLLKNEVVRNVILKYLEAQSDRPWRNLMLKRDLYDAVVAMQLSAASAPGDGGEMDYKRYSEISKSADAMLKELTELEDAYWEDYKFVEINFNEIEKEAGAAKSSLNIEHNRFVSK